MDHQFAKAELLRAQHSSRGQLMEPPSETSALN